MEGFSSFGIVICFGQNEAIILSSCGWKATIAIV